MTMSRQHQLQYEHDLMKVSQLYLRGETQEAIGVAIGKNRSTVSRDLQELHRRWLEKAGALTDVAKARELARIDQLELTYWDAWLDSRRAQETSSSKKVTGKEPRTEAVLRKKTTAGDPRFLDGVRWCVEQRCKILGLYAPVRQEIVTLDAVDQAIAELERDLARLDTEGVPDSF